MRHHSWYGKFAIHDKQWKLVLAPGSGGWESPNDSEVVKQGLPPIQLYDMESDPSETKNVQAENPEIVDRLLNDLEKQVDQGRSTPGAPQKKRRARGHLEEPGDNQASGREIGNGQVSIDSWRPRGTTQTGAAT